MQRLGSPGVPGRKTLHAHLRVAEQAEELLLSTYEELMRINEVREAWRRKHPGASERTLYRSFVKKFLFLAVPGARALMAAQLGQATDPVLQELLYEALVLDGSLKRGRGRPLLPQAKAQKS